MAELLQQENPLPGVDLAKVKVILLKFYLSGPSRSMAPEEVFTRRLSRDEERLRQDLQVATARAFGGRVIEDGVRQDTGQHVINNLTNATTDVLLEDLEKNGWSVIELFQEIQEHRGRTVATLVFKKDLRTTVHGFAKQKVKHLLGYMWGYTHVWLNNGVLTVNCNLPKKNKGINPLVVEDGILTYIPKPPE